MNINKLAFVIPWFGSSIGGAEILCKGLVSKLAESGYDVEVLTTCGKDAFSEWDEDFYPVGKELIDGIIVRRFPLNKRDLNVYHNLNNKLANEITLNKQEVYDYLLNTVNSADLYNFIRENKDKYLYFFMPYLYGTTYYGSIIAPENSYHIPCLHDESNAYFSAYNNMFMNCRGIFCLSKAEMNLAKSIYENVDTVKYFLLGAGIDNNNNGDADAFRKKFNIKDDFVICVGRKVEGKGSSMLKDYFMKFARESHSNVKLVLVGDGDIFITEEDEQYVIDMGVLSDEDKHNAIAASSFLIQPSFFESFSIVLMEAWLLKKAVIVNENCKVTVEHCTESNGGLYFENYPEFYECMKLLIRKDKFRDQLGRNGRDYVIHNYMWKDVINRFKEFLEKTGN